MVSWEKWDNVVILSLLHINSSVFQPFFKHVLLCRNIATRHWYLGIRLIEITHLSITMGCAGCELWQCELVSVNKIEHKFVYPSPRLLSIILST